MLVLENAHIAALSGNDTLVSEFPMFMTLRKAIQKGRVRGSGCNCSKNTTPNTAISPDYNSIKMTLATMSQTDKDRFKTITGFPQIKIIYSTGSGTITTVI
jgi:hypothetical protein